MRRFIPWSRTRAKDNNIIDFAEPPDITNASESQEAAEQPQEQGIACHVVEVLSASEYQAPPSRFPLDNQRGVILEGPHRGIPGFSIGSSAGVGRVLLKRPCTKYHAADREAVVWRVVPSHPHILQFLGACKVTRQWYYAVPYLHLFPMLVYLHVYPDVDRGPLVLQLCDALSTLHSSEIAHGRVGITNLLVSNNRAILFDFCQSQTQAQGFEEDVFDFGITIAEILRAKQYNHRMFRLFRSHPHRPSWASPERVAYGPIWDVAAWCWRPTPSRRPAMPEIFEALSKSLASMRPAVPPASGVDTAIEAPGRVLPQELSSSAGTPPHSEPLPRPQNHSSSSNHAARPRSAPSTPLPMRAALPQESEDQWTECIAIPGLPSLRYRRIQSAPHATGGFSDVWMCDTTYSDERRALVAEKVLRRATRFHTTDFKLLRKLAQEIKIWRNLHHRCIAPLMGFTVYPSISLISPWYRNGNVQNYIRCKPNCDRLKLLHEIAEGLTYLHEFSPPVVHGDIKPDNILIDDNGSAVIIDFGLSRFVAKSISESISSNRGAGNYRWMAPELVDGALPKSLEGDVYSFASLGLKILTEALPFKDLTRGSALVLALFWRNPPAPVHTRQPMRCNQALETPMWKLLDDCWAALPAERPRMRVVEARIHELRRLDVVVADAQSSIVPHSSAGGDSKEDEKEGDKEVDQEAIRPMDIASQPPSEKSQIVEPPNHKPSLLSSTATLRQRALGRLFNLISLERRSVPLRGQS